MDRRDEAYKITKKFNNYISKQYRLNEMNELAEEFVTHVLGVGTDFDVFKKFLQERNVPADRSTLLMEAVYKNINKK